MMNPRRSSPRRGAKTLLIAGLVAIGLLVAYVSRDELEDRVVQPAPVATVEPVEAVLTGDERGLYEFIAPRLAALIAEADKLESLGRERSRNIIQLQVRADRVSQLADEIDGYLTAHPASERLAPTIARYAAAIVDVRVGMADSRSAVLRFDWDAVAAGLDRFAAGTAELKLVLSDLQGAVAQSATPAIGSGLAIGTSA